MSDNECNIIDYHSGNTLYTFKYSGVSKILHGTNAICAELDDGSMMVVPLTGLYLVRLHEANKE